ncbi:hypothetical protein, partial [Gemmobacter sp.]|uniref:hypothetical protein n=1 Tax=Gemmobacter sp. TaxID=1898957 RepID=UPI0025BA0F2A
SSSAAEIESAFDQKIRDRRDDETPCAGGFAGFAINPGTFLAPKRIGLRKSSASAARAPVICLKIVQSGAIWALSPGGRCKHGRGRFPLAETAA